MNDVLPSNPFCTRFVRPSAVEYQFNGIDTAPELIRLAQELFDRRRGLIVGPHGTGKTTLVHSLLPYLSDLTSAVAHVQLSAPLSSRGASSQEWASSRWWDRLRHQYRMTVAIRQQQSRLASSLHRSRDRGLLIIDGAEQLNRVSLASLLAWASRWNQVVLATSHQPLRSMTILHETDVSSPLVRSLSANLLADTPAKVKKLVEHHLDQRVWTRSTNVRELWFDLYDVVQSATQTADNSQSKLDARGQS